jgi:hypothetical protein
MRRRSHYRSTRATDTLAHEGRNVTNLLPRALVISGLVGVSIGLALLWITPAGFWPLMLGLVGVVSGMMAGRLESIRRQTLQAYVALGFLVLALAMLYAGRQAIANGEPGAATLRIVGGLAGLSVPLGWVAGLIAEERLSTGKGGSFSRLVLRLWGRRGRNL